MNQNEPETRPARAALPKIRTMQTDVERYVREKKVSLASMAAAASNSRPEAALAGHPAGRRLRLAAAGALFLILAGGAVAGWIFFRPSPAPPAAEEPAPPAALAPDSEETIVLEDNQPFADALQRIKRADRRAGTLHRIVLRASDGVRSRPLGLGDFFKLVAGTGAFGAIGEREPPQFFTYAAGTGPKFILVFKPRDRARALDFLRAREPSLPTDFKPLSSGAVSETGQARFGDRTYRNIDYRFIAPGDDPDSGLGYLYFPARDLIIMTTSETALEAAANRLFLTP